MKIEFDDAKHIYTVDGEILPSVTEIASMVSNYNAIPVSKETLAYAAARGTAVHEACEAIDYGFYPEVPEEIAGYVKAYDAFLRDYSPEWYGIEEIVANTVYGFAGTLDRCGVIDGIPCILDIKTNSSPSVRNYVSVCIQTAAYAVVKDLSPYGAGSAKRYALYLKKDGTYRLFDCNEYEKKNGFSGFEMFVLLNSVLKDIRKISRKEKK